MERYSFIIIIVVISLISCSSNPEMEGNDPPHQDNELQKMDSIKVQQIDQLSDSISYLISEGICKKTVLSPGYQASEDILTYYSIGDSLIGITYAIRNDSITVRQTYMALGGALSWARLREWTKLSDPPHASEYIFYLDADTIFYASEKQFDLALGEPPVQIGTTPMQMSSSPRDTLNKVLAKDWINLSRIAQDHLTKQK